MFRAVIVGIPGVGKTTIVNMLSKRIKNTEVVNFGTVMLEIAMKKGLVENRDMLRKLPVEEQRKIQKSAARKIASMKGKNVIVDTHLFIRTKEGYWPGLPFDVVRLLKPTSLILVEASASEIVQRRKSDPTRYRDSESQQELEQELSIARSFLSVCSVITGAPMLIVRNEQGRVDAAAKEILSCLEGE